MYGNLSAACAGISSVPVRVFLPCLHGYFFPACAGTSSLPARVLLPCLCGYFFRACTGTSSLPVRVLLPCLCGYFFPPKAAEPGAAVGGEEVISAAQEGAQKRAAWTWYR